MKPHGGNKPALLVRFDPDQAAALERLATATRRSMSEVVRRAVDQYLANQIESRP